MITWVGTYNSKKEFLNQVKRIGSRHPQRMECFVGYVIRYKRVDMVAGLFTEHSNLETISLIATKSSVQRKTKKLLEDVSYYIGWDLVNDETEIPEPLIEKLQALIKINPIPELNISILTVSNSETLTKFKHIAEGEVQVYKTPKGLIWRTSHTESQEVFTADNSSAIVNSLEESGYVLTNELKKEIGEIGKKKKCKEFENLIIPVFSDSKSLQDAARQIAEDNMNVKFVFVLKLSEKRRWIHYRVFENGKLKKNASVVLTNRTLSQLVDRFIDCNESMSEKNRESIQVAIESILKEKKTHTIQELEYRGVVKNCESSSTIAEFLKDKYSGKIQVFKQMTPLGVKMVIKSTSNKKFYKYSYPSMSLKQITNTYAKNEHEEFSIEINEKQFLTKLVSLLANVKLVSQPRWVAWIPTSNWNTKEQVDKAVATYIKNDSKHSSGKLYVWQNGNKIGFGTRNFSFENLDGTLDNEKLTAKTIESLTDAGYFNCFLYDLKPLIKKTLDSYNKKGKEMHIAEPRRIEYLPFRMPISSYLMSLINNNSIVLIQFEFSNNKHLKFNVFEKHKNERHIERHEFNIGQKDKQWFDKLVSSVSLTLKNEDINAIRLSIIDAIDDYNRKVSMHKDKPWLRVGAAQESQESKNLSVNKKLQPQTQIETPQEQTKENQMSANQENNSIVATAMAAVKNSPLATPTKNAADQAGSLILWNKLMQTIDKMVAARFPIVELLEPDTRNVVTLMAMVHLTGEDGMLRSFLGEKKGEFIHERAKAAYTFATAKELESWFLPMMQAFTEFTNAAMPSAD